MTRRAVREQRPDQADRGAVVLPDRPRQLL